MLSVMISWHSAALCPAFWQLEHTCSVGQGLGCRFPASPWARQAVQRCLCVQFGTMTAWGLDTLLLDWSIPEVPGRGTSSPSGCSPMGVGAAVFGIFSFSSWVVRSFLSFIRWISRSVRCQRRLDSSSLGILRSTSFGLGPTRALPVLVVYRARRPGCVDPGPRLRQRAPRGRPVRIG